MRTILLTLFLTGGVAYGADQPLTLQEAIRIAGAHSTPVQVALKSYEAALARIGQRVSQQRPQVAFQGSATQFDDRTTVSLPGMSTPFEVMPNHQETLAVALNQDLDISGELRTAVAQAKLNALASHYGFLSALEDQSLSTTTAYYMDLRAEQDVRVAAAALDAYREQLKTAEKLYQGGVGQKIDVDRAESQVASAESDLTQRENDRDSARSALNDILGRPLDTPLELVDPASHMPVPPAQPEDRSKLIAKALDRRPEALAAAVQVAAAGKGIKLAQVSSDPALTLSVAGTNYPTTSFENPRSNVGAVTLSLSIPIFDGGLARERMREARSAVDIAKAQQDQTRRSISLEVQNAALAVQTARKRLDAANAALKAAQATRDLAQTRYQAQVSLYLEITDAQSALTAAQSAQVDATYDLLTAQARLARSLSEPIAG